MFARTGFADRFRHRRKHGFLMMSRVAISSLRRSRALSEMMINVDFASWAGQRAPLRLRPERERRRDIFASFLY